MGQSCKGRAIGFFSKAVATPPFYFVLPICYFMPELWTEKFFPKSAEEFIGNSDIVEKAFEWARKWEKGVAEPPLLLWGQSGSGKTCLAYLLASHFKWSIVELNSSDLRSREAIEKIVGAASQNASFFGSRRLILIDEVDALSREDRGGASAISAVIKGSKNPIVLTANDIFSDKAVSALRFVCRALEFKKINYLSMAKRLREILSSEGIPFEDEAVKALAQNSSGDMRSALLDLQTIAMAGKIGLNDVNSLSSRERQQKIFAVMKAIFKGTDFAEVRAARAQSDLSSEMLFNWVEENIPRQYSRVNDVALAFDRLSRADVFNGRIFRRQEWGFLRYSSELAAEGVALAKEKASNEFVAYQFPGLLSVLSRASGERALRKGIGQKIGKKTHSSVHEIISRDMPFIKIIFGKKENAVSFSALFGLDEKEIGFLLGAKPDSKKVHAIFEEASAFRESMARPKTIFGGSAQTEENEKGFADQDSAGNDSVHENSKKNASHGKSEGEGGAQTRLF